MAATICGRLAELLAVDQQIAEPLGRAHEFGRDHEHPAEPEARRAAPRHRPAAPPAAGCAAPCARPDRRKTRPTSTILRSTATDRAHHAEIDREEHADRDQRHLRGLEDAEPQDEQRHPGDRGDGAQRLQGRIEQAPRQRRVARRPRRAACRPRRRGRSRRTTRSSVAATWREQLAGRGELRRRSAKMRDGGGTSRPSRQPETAPRASQAAASADRQQQAEQRPSERAANASPSAWRPRWSRARLRTSSAHRT